MLHVNNSITAGTRLDSAPLRAKYDLLVVGGGNAALCAALTARKQGLSVAVLEAAPKHMRGGNTRHTRNLRLAHDQPTEFLSDNYSVDEYLEDLLKVTRGDTNEELARFLLEQSLSINSWMESMGARFQASLSGTLSLGRTNAFFLGGGKTLLNGYYLMAESMGVEPFYQASVTGISIQDDRCDAVTVHYHGRNQQVKCRALVVASGGYQSNPEWLQQDWGDAAQNLLIRGTPFNQGGPLKLLIEAGFARVGHPGQAHMVAIDGRSPRYDGGIATRLDCVPFSVVVNRDCQRFYDEGEDFWPKRYAIWGRLVAKQPMQVAYALIDSKAIDLFMPTVYEPYRADSIEQLATLLGLDSAALNKAVKQFNVSCREGAFDPGELDGLTTQGLMPEKTNWARSLDTPPYFGYVLKPGVTFTYLGVKVDRNARVLNEDGEASPNMFAAGEIMAGNILGRGYLAGTGMTIGTVFGRCAGESAAKYVKTDNETTL